MSNEIQALKIKVCKDKLNFIMKQYEETCKAELSTIDPATKVTHEEKIAQLEKEMDECQKKIDELSQQQPRSPGEPSRAHVDLGDKFSDINFTKQMELLGIILNKHQMEAAAALFLLPDCLDMKGEWLIKRFQRELISRLKHEAKVRYMPVRMPYDSLTLFNFLKKLGSHLNRSPVQQDDLKGYTNSIIEVMNESLERDQVVLCEVTITATFNESEMVGFFNSFLQDFWHPLVNKWSTIATQTPVVNWIVVLAVDSIIPEPCLSLCSCSIEQFSSEKIFYLPLTKWSETEIWQWLHYSSGLQLPLEESRNIAKGIYKGSQSGKPIQVETKLRAELKQYIQ